MALALVALCILMLKLKSHKKLKGMDDFVWKKNGG